jgi:hypothetical protein
MSVTLRLLCLSARWRTVMSVTLRLLYLSARWRTVMSFTLRLLCLLRRRYRYRMDSSLGGLQNHTFWRR